MRELKMPARKHFFVFVLSVVGSLLTTSILAQRAPQTPATLENFDIRTDTAPNSATYMIQAGARSLSPASAALAGVQTAGFARLQSNFSLDVISNPEFGTPEVIGSEAGSGFLTGPSIDREGAMRSFLSTYADAYGLVPGEVSTLAMVANYENPAGNMGWVEFEQRINGIPVFQGLIRGGFTSRGELARTTGRLAPGLSGAVLPVTPSFSAGEAVSQAMAGVGWSVPAAGLVQKSADAAGIRFERGAMAGEPRAGLVYFPLAPGVARLAWVTEIWGDPDVYMIVRDAADGTVLFRKNLTEYLKPSGQRPTSSSSLAAEQASYFVYLGDGPAPLSPSNALPAYNTQAPYVPRNNVILIGNEPPNTFNNLGWINDGTNITDGNNVEAGLDRDGINGVDAPVAGAPNRVFLASYNPQTDDPLTPEYQRGEVIDTFYWSNVYHDRLYLLGFTEAGRNFQNDNFSRGGVAGDRVSAESQDSSGTNNANFSTPPDGSRGRMQMYIFTGPTPARSSGLEHEVLLHELTHGTSNRLHNNANGLTSTMSRGMGEGWSDFYARALLSTVDEDPSGVYTTGGWITYFLSPGYIDNYYYGIRRFPYAVKTSVGANSRPHNPLTFADIDPTQINTTDGAYPRNPLTPSTAFQVHNIGEVWCMALLEVRTRFIARLGFPGNDRFLQFVTDGMKLDNSNPTLLQGRDSILAAANAGGGTTADIADIWAGFATRGMGYSALVLNANTGNVIEAFNLPAPSITTHPTNSTLGAGQTATLSVTASGLPPLTYQWYVGTSGNTANPIPGATARTYITPALSATTSYWVRVSSVHGNASSNTATVTVTYTPLITAHPGSLSILPGQSRVLNVGAIGAPPLMYQWYFGTSGNTGSPISGATASSYSTGPLSITASYWVRISNSFGHADSNSAIVSIGTAPVIITHPANQNIGSQQTATLSVVASGSPPPTYQWFNGISGNMTSPISGATAASYTTTTLSAPADYWVRVTNVLGSANSNTATIITGSFCGFILNKNTFVTGDSIIIQNLRVTNAGTSVLPVEYKFWVNLPGGGILGWMQGGADGSVVLPGSAVINDALGGPQTLAAVTSTFPPRGSYSLQCGLEDPVTARDLFVGGVPFTVQ